MAPVVTSEGIKAALSCIYARPDTLKGRYVEMIREAYEEGDGATPAGISTEAVIERLWGATEPQEVKRRRRNLSSLRSSINKELRRAWEEGRNPQGLVIGPDNHFVISDEAKTKIVEQVAERVGADGLAHLDELLSGLNALKEAVLGQGADELKESGKLDLLRETFQEMASALGFQLSEGEEGEGAGEVDVVEVEDEREFGEDEDEEVELVEALEEEEPEEGEEEEVETVEEVAEEEDGEELEEVFEEGAEGEEGEEVLADEELGEEIEEEELIEEEEPEDEGEEEVEELLMEEEDGPEADGEVEADLLEQVDEDAVEVVVQEGLEEGEGPLAGEEEYDEVEEEGQEGSEDEVVEIEEGDELGPEEVMEEVEEDEDEEVELVEALEEEGPEDVEGEEAEAVEETAEEEDGEELEEVFEEVAEGEEVEEEVLADEGLPEEELIEEGELEEEGEEEFEEELDATELELDEEELEEVEDLRDGEEGDGVVEELVEVVPPTIQGGVPPERAISIQEANRRQREFETFLIQKDQELNIHVEVEGGTYTVGGSALGAVFPRRRVELSSFKLKVYPVTNALFAAFVEQTGYRTVAERRGRSRVFEPRVVRVHDPSGRLLRFSLRPHPGSRLVDGACWHQPEGPGSTIFNRRHHPVVHVCMEDALAFAAWTGCRLPSEEEWEAAARTRRGLLFPWGNRWEGGRANVESSQIGATTPVTRFRDSANPLGLVDLLGNVWEMTATVEGQGEKVVAKGGCWLSGPDLSLLSRSLSPVSETSNILGFRCVVIG